MAFFRCGGGKTSLILPNNPKEITAKAADGKVTLVWQTPETEAQIAHYNVYYSLTAPLLLEDLIKVGETTDLSMEINELENNTKYYFVVTSVDTDGYENASVKNYVTATPISMFLIVGTDKPAVSYDGGYNFESVEGVVGDFTECVINIAGRYIAFADYRIWESIDGKHWALIHSFGESNHIRLATYDENQKIFLVIINNVSSGDFTLYVSNDLVNWNTKRSPIAGITVSSSEQRGYSFLKYIDGYYYMLFSKFSSSSANTYIRRISISDFNANNVNWETVATQSGYLAGSKNYPSRNNAILNADKEIVWLASVVSDNTNYILKYDLATKKISTFKILTSYTAYTDIALGNGYYIVTSGITNINKPILFVNDSNILAKNIGTYQTTVTFANDRFYILGNKDAYQSENLRFFESLEFGVTSELSRIKNGHNAHFIYCNK